LNLDPCLPPLSKTETPPPYKGRIAVFSTVCGIEIIFYSSGIFFHEAKSLCSRFAGYFFSVFAPFQSKRLNVTSSRGASPYFPSPFASTRFLLPVDVSSPCIFSRLHILLVHPVSPGPHFFYFPLASQSSHTSFPPCRSLVGLLPPLTMDNNVVFTFPPSPLIEKKPPPFSPDRSHLALQ